MGRLRREIAHLNHAVARMGVHGGSLGQRDGRWPAPAEIQSILFARTRFTAHQARSWARRHGFAHRKVDVTDANVRIRQADPSQFTDFRTIVLTEGVQAVVGPRR